jgi:hypothetical protein
MANITQLRIEQNRKNGLINEKIYFIVHTDSMVESLYMLRKKRRDIFRKPPSFSLCGALQWIEKSVQGRSM